MGLVFVLVFALLSGQSLQQVTEHTINKRAIAKELDIMSGSNKVNILRWCEPRVIDTTEADPVRQPLNKYHPECAYYLSRFVKGSYKDYGVVVEPGDIVYEFAYERYFPALGWMQNSAVAVIRDGEIVFMITAS